MSLLYTLFGKLLYFLYSLVHNYGVAIILFTILIKLILLPLNIKSTKSMREIQMLNPALQHLQKKYQNNQEKLNMEVTRLYQIYKVNPMGGCLPLFLQLPVLYGLFGALRMPEQYVFVNMNMATVNQHFLWLNNLGAPDPYYILPVLCVVFTFLTSWYTNKVNPPPDSSAAGTQNMMMYMMPLLIGFMAMSLPAGIALYWVVQNIFTFLQQFMMLRKPVEPIPIKEAEAKLAEFNQNRKNEIKAKKQEASKARQDMYDKRMGTDSDDENEKKKKKPSVKTTPVKKRKTITKIPERKE